MIDFQLRNITQTLHLDRPQQKGKQAKAVRSLDALDLATAPKAGAEGGLLSPKLCPRLPLDIRRKLTTDAIAARHRDRTPPVTYTMYFSRVGTNNPVGAMSSLPKAPISMALLARAGGAFSHRLQPTGPSLPHVPGYSYDLPNHVKFSIARLEKELPCNRNLQDKLTELPEIMAQEPLRGYIELLGLQPQMANNRTMVRYWEHEAKALGNEQLPSLQFDLPPGSSDELPKQAAQYILDAARDEAPANGDTEYLFARLQRHDPYHRHMDPLPTISDMGVVQNKIRDDGTDAPTKTWAMNADGRETAYTKAERLQAETLKNKQNHTMWISCHYQGNPRKRNLDLSDEGSRKRQRVQN